MLIFCIKDEPIICLGLDLRILYHGRLTPGLMETAQKVGVFLKKNYSENESGGVIIWLDINQKIFRIFFLDQNKKTS